MTPEFSITTPAVIFSAVSLLYIGYTSRFIAISNLVRDLKKEFVISHDEIVIKQITNLRRRIEIIRNMQLLGILSLMLSILSMILLYKEWLWQGEMAFFVALCFLLLSMFFAIQEVLMSVDAINIDLSDIEELKNSKQNHGLLDIGVDIRKLHEKLGFRSEDSNSTE